MRQWTHLSHHMEVTVASHYFALYQRTAYRTSRVQVYNMNECTYNISDINHYCDD